jgi:curved DNA-binding protein CbpA
MIYAFSHQDLTTDRRQSAADAPKRETRPEPKANSTTMDALERMLTARNTAVSSADADAAAAARRQLEKRLASRRESERNDAPNALEAAVAGDGTFTDEDIVRAVLDAHGKKDYFSCLNVRRPDCDDLGRPVWDVSDAELNRAFRRASLRVHPDKNKAEDARKAFDALGETQKLFKDPVKRAEVLRNAAEEAFKEKCKRDPELMRARAKAQEKADAASYADDMKRQREEAKKRAEEVKRRSVKANRRKRAEESDEEDALAAMTKSLEEQEAVEAAAAGTKDSNESDEDQGGAFVGLKRKPKKRFMF